MNATPQLPPEGQEGAGAGAEDAEFIATLTSFQFSTEAIQAIITNGLASTESLIDLSSKDIKSVMMMVRKTTPPIVVNSISKKRLMIMVFWVNRHHKLREGIEALFFIQEEQETYGTMMNSEPDRDTTVKEPPENKGSIKWKLWKEVGISYLISINRRFHPTHLHYQRTRRTRRPWDL